MATYAQPCHSPHFRAHKLTKYFEEDNSFILGNLVVFLSVIFIRLCVSVGDYSGKSTPPMFGDYEAQRHWMEITTNLPINEWYQQSQHNDLQYWGLDYPPLTAYHSWLCGQIANTLYIPQLIQLTTSRGIETPETKFFMRMTVIVSDIILFISAVFTFFHIVYPTQKWNAKITAIFCVLINPLFIIIDHGHFQYNCVALGLTLWSINAMFTHHYYISSVLFVMSMCFKQMSLYYALPFFFYCIGLALKHNSKNKLYAFFMICIFGLVVITTFVIIFYPWLALSTTDNFSAFIQVIRRIFPFERGLFEDKVANVWCSTNIAIKWREIFGELMKICALFATLLASAPCILLIFKPKPKFFLYALCISSLAFFLFSFQVHEKNIIFPLMPISLFILEAPYFISSLTQIAMFSMLPLLKKDGIIYWYWVLNLLWYAVTSWVQPLHSMQYKKHYTVDDDSPSPPLHPIIGRLRLYKHVSPDGVKVKKINEIISQQREIYPRNSLNGHAPPIHYAPLYWCYQPFVSVLYYFMTNVQWDERYPDLGVYFIMIYSCIHFVIAYGMIALQFGLEYFNFFTEDIILAHCIAGFAVKKQKKS